MGGGEEEEEEEDEGGEEGEGEARIKLCVKHVSMSQRHLLILQGHEVHPLLPLLEQSCSAPACLFSPSVT
jgi:hypothetical protein